jgi:hypothetical protein
MIQVRRVLATAILLDPTAFAEIVVATLPDELVMSPVKAGIWEAATLVEVVIKVAAAGIAVPLTLVVDVSDAGRSAAAIAPST